MMRSTAPLSPVAFEIFAKLLKARSGLAISPDKIYLLETRLAPILAAENLPHLGALADRLRLPGTDALARDVTEAMTTNESFFFRDEKPFAHFRDVMLPRLHRDRPPGARLRIWSAAAAAGQEAYSLAMIVAGCADMLGARQVEILGTDISRPQIARAREGLYSRFEVQRGLPRLLRDRFFAPEGSGWRVQRPLRDMPEFREFNLLSDLRPLGWFDIIFCRNVLIYFDAPTKTRVLDAISDQLAYDGGLYMGGAETVLGITDRLVAAEGGAGYVLRP